MSDRGFVTWLPQVLRDAGLDVHVLDGAETRSTWTSGFEMRAIIWHHTATGTNWQDGHVAALLRDGRRDLSGPLSQVGIERDGTWVIVACGRANHNGFGDFGNDALGLEFYNDGVGEPWPQVQVESGKRGIKAIRRHVGWDVPLLGHKESDPGRKVDPFGLDMDEIRGGLVVPPQELDPFGEEEMATIIKSSGGYHVLSGNKMAGIKSMKTVRSFEAAGHKVVEVDDETKEVFYKAFNVVHSVRRFRRS